MNDLQSSDDVSRSEATASPPAARRHWLGSGAAGAAAMALSLVAVACGSDDGPMESSMADADIAPLNALLKAEYNAITAYTAGAGLIAEAAKADPLYALRDVVTEVALSIQAQHRLHAQALVDAIGELGGTPVQEADVAAKFAPPSTLVGNPTISNVLKFAATAERGAAVAYNQVLAGLESSKLRFLASAIEGDESQHFIVLAALVLGLASPGPNLSQSTAAQVVPEAFVSTVGEEPGLDRGVPDYFA